MDLTGDTPAPQGSQPDYTGSDFSGGDDRVARPVSGPMRPVLPGATILRSIFGFYLAARARGCSRPWEPRMRIFTAAPLGLLLAAP